MIKHNDNNDLLTSKDSNDSPISEVIYGSGKTLKEKKRDDKVDKGNRLDERK